jgi:sigma54-dependent transcription regulator
MSDIEKEDFIYPYRSYHGKETLPDIIFDANLQEFSARVAIICALENGGKISPEEAYKQIKELWKEMKASKKNLLDQSNLEGNP